MPPHSLGAPLHRHTREDEYSYVLEGRVGAQLGDEIISPGGFEGYFERLVELFAAGGLPDPAALHEIAADHGLEVDLASIPRLMQEHGLR